MTPQAIALQEARLLLEEAERRHQQAREKLGLAEHMIEDLAPPSRLYCGNCSNVGWYVLAAVPGSYEAGTEYRIERCLVCCRFESNQRAGEAAGPLIHTLLEARAKLLEEQPF